jgi:hypothetical protein
MTFLLLALALWQAPLGCAETYQASIDCAQARSVFGTISLPREVSEWEQALVFHAERRTCEGEVRAKARLEFAGWVAEPRIAARVLVYAKGPDCPHLESWQEISIMALNRAVAHFNEARTGVRTLLDLSWDPETERFTKGLIGFGNAFFCPLRLLPVDR